MLFTGGKYTVATMFDWGLVNHVYKDYDFKKEVMRFTGKLTRRPAGAIKELKRLAHISLSPIPFDEKIEEEGKVVTELFYGKEAKRAIQNLIDKS